MDQQIHKICNNIYKKCFGKGKKNVKLLIFLNPVDLQRYPDYIAKLNGNKPMDLSTLKKQLNVKYTKSAYATFDDFCNDARSIFENCKIYNAGNPALCKQADEILALFNSQVASEMGKVEARLAKIATYTFAEYEQCESILDQCLSVHTIEDTFGIPVPVPNYNLWIKVPMDLGTIKKKLQDGKYNTFEEFEKDMLRVGTNCLHFNNDPDKHSHYRDTAVMYLEKYDKLKRQYLKDLREIPQKSHLYPCRRALDLILIRNRPNEKDAQGLEIKVARPWMFRNVLLNIDGSPSSSTANGEDDNAKPITFGDVSDKLYSLSYESEQGFINDLRYVLSKPPPFPETRDKSLLESDAKSLLNFVDILSSLITLPMDTETKLPIEPADFSTQYPTKWFYELSTGEMVEFIDEISKHTNFAIFGKPVDGTQVKGYDTVIKDKLDLATIRARLKSGIWYYMGKQVLADIDIVANNCKLFNQLYPKYVQLAKSLQQKAKAIYSRKVKEYQLRVTEKERQKKAEKKRLANEEKNKKKAIAAAERAKVSQARIEARVAEKVAKGKADAMKVPTKKFEIQNDIAKNAMLQRKQSYLKQSNSNKNDKTKLRFNVMGNDKKRKREQRGPPQKKARAGPPKIIKNIKNKGTLSIDSSSIGAPGNFAGKNINNSGSSNEKTNEESALEKAEKQLKHLLGNIKSANVEAGPPAFADIGMRDVQIAVKRKNKGAEPKCSPIEEKCKMIYNRMYRDVIGINSIPLNKQYADNFSSKWLGTFNFHPLEVFPQEAFRRSYMNVVPKPIALYFSKDPENEAVYDNILQRVYKKRFDENPSGPTIAEMFLSDAERVFDNAIISNSNGSIVSKWICIKANHFKMYLNHLAHENLFNDEIERYKTKQAQKKILRRQREDFLKDLPLSNARGFGKDRTQEFLVKVMKKLKTQGMKISYQHWNTSKEELMKYPGYTDVIQKAMDLSTVYDLLNKRMYNTYKEILEDIRLCFSNAITFWGRGEDENPVVVDNARKSSEYFEDIWAQASLTIFEYTQREAILKKILNQQKSAARAEQLRKERLEEAREEVKRQKRLAKEEKKKRKNKIIDKFGDIDKEWESLQRRQNAIEEEDTSSSDSDDDDWRGGKAIENSETVETCQLIRDVEEEWREDDDIWRQVGDKGVIVFGKQKASAGLISM